MAFETARYDVRILELQSIRHYYMPLMQNTYTHFWGDKATVWLDELEGGFEWVVQEAISQILKCRVENHLSYDFGKCLLQSFPDFIKDLRPHIEVARFLEYGRPIQHAKVMVLGNVLIVGVIYR